MVLFFSNYNEKDLGVLHSLFTEWTASLNVWKTFVFIALQNCLASKRLSGVFHDDILGNKAAADQMRASLLPKQDYCLEVTCTTVTSGKNLHVCLDLLM